MNNIKYWLKSKKKLVADFQNFVLEGENPGRSRIFIDKGADVLFVAHIDTVLKPEYIRQRRTRSGKVKRVYAHGLDDRLGCMVAYELSERLNADLLICDNEESMKSTGQYHDLKDYNWIAEFDRAGGDVVTYGLDNKLFLTAIKNYWDVGIGSFSDISQLETTACCMNVGIGYEFAHSKDSYVDMQIMKRQIRRFVQFYQENKDIKYVQDVKSLVDDWDSLHSGQCELCGGFTNVESIFDYCICRGCFVDSFYGDIGTYDLRSSLREDAENSDFNKTTENSYIGG